LIFNHIFQFPICCILHSKQPYVIGHMWNDEPVFHENDDDSAGDYGGGDMTCDGNVWNSDARSNGDMHDYGALEDEDWQMSKLIKKAGRLKRI